MLMTSDTLTPSPSPKQTTPTDFRDLWDLPGGTWMMRPKWSYWHWIPDNAARSTDGTKKRVQCGRLRYVSWRPSVVTTLRPESALCSDCVGSLRGSLQQPSEFDRLQSETADMEYCSPSCTHEHKRDFPEEHFMADCLVCGQHRPVGHVIVGFPQNRMMPMGRVCSRHTLMECMKGGVYATLTYEDED